MSERLRKECRVEEMFSTGSNLDPRKLITARTTDFDLDYSRIGLVHFVRFHL